ncbi:glycosyltransferase [Levilactobacillus bambusae]|uniref:Glycosyltransferase family 1 protein n=1 Tax=Levilactobacillus bambusae TaxID=2024736 RepID=A0A2V1MXB6_9LACO|nr:glycosyltransferase [Levilactobacillus bambusae]PWF99656.1 hypothetical protein DCM90_07520 [Levilactobacillus bambusae]
MLTVLEVCEAYGGGVKRHVDHLYDHLNTDHIKIMPYVTTTRINEAAPDDYLVDNRQSEFYKPWNLWRVLRQLHRLVRENDVNIMHAHSSYAGMIVFLYTFFLNHQIKVFYTAHAYYSEKPLAKWKRAIILVMEKLITSRANLVIHVSDDEQAYALREKIVTEDKAVVVNNGVSEPKNCHYADNAPVVINIARCDAQKNPLEFVEIAYKVLQTVPEAQFIYAGGGVLLADMQAITNNLGISANVHFVGHISDVDPYYRQAKVFLSTAHYEGMPFSVIDALAYQIPVVLSSVTGHKGLVTNHNGHLYTPGHIDSAAHLVTEYLQAVVVEDSQRSFALYQQQFRLEDMVSQIAAKYEHG